LPAILGAVLIENRRAVHFRRNAERDPGQKRYTSLCPGSRSGFAAKVTAADSRSDGARIAGQCDMLFLPRGRATDCRAGALHHDGRNRARHGMVRKHAAARGRPLPGSSIDERSRHRERGKRRGEEGEGEGTSASAIVVPAGGPQVCIQNQLGSTSLAAAYEHRRSRGRIIDQLDCRRVGTPNGSKPRDVLVDSRLDDMSPGNGNQGKQGGENAPAAASVIEADRTA